MNYTLLFNKKFVFFLTFLFQVIVVLSIYYIYGEEAAISPDAITYYQPAKELIGFGTFTNNGLIETMRTPGYPIFLTLFISFDNWVILVNIAQCLLSAIMAVFIFIICEKLSDNRWGGGGGGFIAALIFTITPTTFIYNSFILTERLTSFFMVIIYFLFLKLFDLETNDSKKFYLFVSSIALLTFLAIFTRPANIFLPFIFVFFTIIFTIRRKFSISQTAIASFLLLAITLIPVILWSYRNFAAINYKGFTTISALNMYEYNAPLAIKNQSDIPEFLKQNLIDKNITKDRYENLGEYYMAMQNEGIRIIKENLPFYAINHLKTIIPTIFGAGIPKFIKIYAADYVLAFKEKRLAEFILQNLGDFLYFFSATGFLCAVYLFFAIGFIKVFKQNKMFAIFTIALIGYFILIGGGASYSRFREPINFIFPIFAAITLTFLPNFFRTRFTRDRP